MATAGDVIQVNVGGRLFYATRSTMCSQASMLARLFDVHSDFGHNLDSEGRIFIDRDGDLFEHVLSFLRKGKFIAPQGSPVFMAHLLTEAEFFGLELMAASIRNWVGAMGRVDEYFAIGLSTVTDLKNMGFSAVSIHDFFVDRLVAQLDDGKSGGEGAEERLVEAFRAKKLWLEIGRFWDELFGHLTAEVISAEEHAGQRVVWRGGAEDFRAHYGAVVCACDGELDDVMGGKRVARIMACRQHTSILHGQKQPKNRNIHEVSSFEAVRLLRFAQIGGGAGGASAGD